MCNRVVREVEFGKYSLQRHSLLALAGIGRFTHYRAHLRSPGAAVCTTMGATVDDVLPAGAAGCSQALWGLLAGRWWRVSKQLVHRRARLGRGYVERGAPVATDVVRGVVVVVRARRERCGQLHGRGLRGRRRRCRRWRCRRLRGRGLRSHGLRIGGWCVCGARRWQWKQHHQPLAILRIHLYEFSQLSLNVINLQPFIWRQNRKK